MEFFIPATCVDIFAFCVDAQNPPANVENWVQENHLYKVKALTPALNDAENNSVILVDRQGQEIHPKEDMRGFKENRFKYMNIFKN